MSLQSKIQQCIDEINSLSQMVEESRVARNKEQNNGITLPTVSEELGVAPLRDHKMKQRTLLSGHFGKVFALSWCENTDENLKHMLVSASQDGKLLGWDAKLGIKRYLIPLVSAWVMTVAYSKDGQLVACGGLDDTCSVYETKSAIQGAPQPRGANGRDTLLPRYSLQKHEGYLSCCKFINNSTLITSSGDMSLMLWDLASGRQVPTMTMIGHESDVMSVTTNAEGNLAISGSCDGTCRVWDVRTGKNVQTFYGHESDVNAVTMFPNDHSFGSASDDSSCRIFDMRSWSELAVLRHDKILSSVTSLAFSSSGRLMFAGYDDQVARVWDVCAGNLLMPALQGHTNRVSCLGVDVSGSVLATGGWDHELRCWA